MNTVLLLSLVIIVGAALWPKSTYGRSRLKAKQPPVYETKGFDHEALQKAAVRLKALDERPTAEASQKAAVKRRDGNSIREFEERWIGHGPVARHHRGVCR